MAKKLLEKKTCYNSFMGQ